MSRAFAVVQPRFLALNPRPSDRPLRNFDAAKWSSLSLSLFLSRVPVNRYRNEAAQLLTRMPLDQKLVGSVKEDFCLFAEVETRLL